MEKVDKVLNENIEQDLDQEISQDKIEFEKSDLKYSDDDVNRIIDKKFAQWKKKQDAELEEERKKAKMDAEQLRSYESEQKDKKIAEYEAKIEKMNLSNIATKSLSDKGYVPNDELLGFVIRKDEDSTLRAIDEFNSLVENQVNARLKESARQEVPKTSRTTATPTTSSGFADFAKQNRVVGK